MDVQLRKGNGMVRFSVPEQTVLGTLTGQKIKGLSFDRIKKSIETGVRNDAPEDIQNKKVVIIIPDHTRLWARGDLFVPVIINTLIDLGVVAQNIQIIIALGTHQDADIKEWPMLAGDSGSRGIQILNSANQDRDRLVHIGKTSQGTDLYFTREAVEADHIIIFGGVLHHLIAGFGGGRKYIFPGIAGYDAIQQNHSLAFLPDGRPHPMVKQAQLEDNPVNQDLAEAADLFLKGKTCTYAAVAVNGEGDIFYADAGKLKPTFHRACAALHKACSPVISRKGDFALISAGGNRSDEQLYQATKALFNTVNAVKEKGSILFVVQAAQGVGNEMFGRMLSQYKACPEKLGQKLVQKFNMPSYVAFRVLDLLHRFDIFLLSDFSKKQNLDLGFKFADDIDKFIANRLKGRGYIIPFAENILPVLPP